MNTWLGIVCDGQGYCARDPERPLDYYPGSLNLRPATDTVFDDPRSLSRSLGLKTTIHPTSKWMPIITQGRIIAVRHKPVTPLIVTLGVGNGNFLEVLHQDKLRDKYNLVNDDVVEIDLIFNEDRPSLQ
jgi:CTP-dependent riboflavin kinase